MHGLRTLRGALRRKLKDERGWALIDAVASSAVVVLAFVGTTMAFNGSEASVARDQKKTQAMIVAQNEINRMRGLAQQPPKFDGNDGTRGVDGVLALNGTTSTVVYQGINYTVEYESRYVTGLGTDDQGACDVPYSGSGGTARYVYMRVNVTYAGQMNVASGSGSSYLSSPASLDTYFTPDSNGAASNTGTLRVYVLDRNSNVVTGIGSVTLTDPASGTDRSPKSSNTSNGCYLFTGLARNTYTVNVSASGTLQDLYMTNSSSRNKVTLPVVMPERGALSREVRLSTPVTVTPIFRVNTGANPNFTVTYSSTYSNAWFGGTSTRPGNWIAGSTQIRTAPSADFSPAPYGIAFMPHRNTPTQSTLPNAMFPLKEGYGAFAGPCDANDPNAGAADGVNNQVQVPINPSDSNWVGGGTYQPVLWLSQIRATYSAVQKASKPTSGIVVNRAYYYDQAFNSGGGGVTIWVRQEADAEGATTNARCNTGFTSFNQWVQLPGSLSTPGTYLNDISESLPAGTYDLCVQLPFTYKTATGRTSTTLNTEQNRSAVATYTYTVDTSDSEPDIPPLLYNTSFTRTAPYDWSADNTSLTPAGGGTTCAS